MNKFFDKYEKISTELEATQKNDINNHRQERPLEIVFREKTGNTFSHFHNVYYNKLVWFLQSKLSSTTVAKDIATEAFMKALSKINDYDQNYKFTTWLFIMANNMAGDYLIKEKKHTLISLETKFDDGQTLLDTINEMNFTEECNDEKILMKYNIMKNSIDKLAPKYKEIIQMREYDKMSYKDIAQKLGLNESTAKSRILQGRKTLVQNVKNKFNKIEELY